MRFFTTLFLFLFAGAVTAQTVDKPTSSFQSLPYVNINKIVMTDSFTVFYMTYEYTGDEERWLHADTNYYIREENQSEKKRLIKAEGLPWTPERHVFKSPETISFVLYFPPLSPGTNYLTFIQGTETKSTSSNFNYYFNFYAVKLDPVRGEKEPHKEPHNKAPQYNGSSLKVNDSIALKILFDKSSDHIVSGSEDELTTLLKFMQEHPTIVIELAGHTEKDETGASKIQRKSNMELSLRRVEKVKEYLVSNKISSKRILIKAYGGTRPVSSDPAQNRRVVMRIVKI